VAKYSGQAIFAPYDAVVTSVTSSRITIKNGTGEEQAFDLVKLPELIKRRVSINVLS